MRRLALPLTCLTLLLLALPAGRARSSISRVTPNDPLFEHCSDPKCVDEQWNLMSDGRGISADLAWSRTRGSGTVIADIDTGINFNHEDLKNQIWTNKGELGIDKNGNQKCCNGIDDDHNGYVDDWRGWDFYENDNDPSDDAGYGHGTGTSGIAVAEQNNGLGISGVAPKAKLMVLRAGDTYIVGPARVAQAIYYAVDNGANVITMSLGSIGTGGVLRAAVKYAQDHGVVLVAATANEFSIHPNSPTWLDPVIGAGAIVPDTDGSGAPLANDFTVKAGFSNYGPGVDVVAPADVYATLYGGGYGKFSGTSSATPEVAGVADLVVAQGKSIGLPLSSEEVTQIIRQSADDLVGGPYNYAVGWDQYTGWGRVDAGRAVSMVDPAKLPPLADILSPGWYQDVKGPVKILGRIQAAHPPFTWKVLVGQGIEPSSWTKVGHGVGHDPLAGTIGRFDPAGLPDGLYTLVLEVTDASGIVGEDRQAFTVQRDPSLLAAFPLTLGASAESSPKFADLGGDGSQELIVADQSGRVHALEASGKELPGWPVHENAAASPAGPVRAGFVSTPAVADLNGDSRPDVVIGGLDGNVYAWDAAGHPLPGWPVPTKVPPGGDPSNPHWEATVISSPAVGEIDGNVADGPEVVVGAGDGKVYAFHSDGTPVAGFPVLLQDPSQAKETAKIASSPAIGDIDGDKQNEIVIGDGETYGNSARVYALRGDGSYEPGWPVTLTGLAPNVTPVVGQGVPESPVLADINGDGALEVAISGVTTRFHLLQGNGTEAPGGASLQFFSASFGPNRDPNLSAPDAVATVANLAFGDMNRDGHPDMASGLTDSRLFAAFQRPGQRIPFQHMVAVWTTGPGGAMFKAFPRVVEDWMFITAPVFADVDGDGKPEMVIGNGDGYVHAFKPNGDEATGWPKYVGQWVEAAVAAGDIDNDGKTDIAVVTRQGQVFVFSTDGSASGLDWPSMRGTPANTGVFVEP